MRSSRIRDSKRVLCGVLALVPPYLPLHRFILGDVKGGVIRLLLIPVGGLGALITYIEGIVYLSKSDEDFVEIYEDGDKEWF